MKNEGNQACDACTLGNPKALDDLFGPESVASAELPPQSLVDSAATMQIDDPAEYEQVQIKLLALFGPED